MTEKKRKEWITYRKQTWNDVVSHIRSLESQKTESQYVGGKWLNRISKITITKKGGLWNITETL